MRAIQEEYSFTFPIKEKYKLKVEKFFLSLHTTFQSQVYFIYAFLVSLFKYVNTF